MEQQSNVNTQIELELLKKEFDDGNFDKRDVNTHQAKSYLLRLQRQKETITPGTSQPEVFNVLGQLDFQSVYSALLQIANTLQL